MLRVWWSLMLTGVFVNVYGWETWGILVGIVIGLEVAAYLILKGLSRR